MPQTLSNKEYIVTDGQPSKDEAIELKVQSREEEILRQLGILHLDNKVTRPKYSNDESDVAILQLAGVVYVSTDEYKENASKKDNQDVKKKEKTKGEMGKKLTRSEAEILRRAGVTWLDNMTAVYDDDDDTYCDKLGCGTSVTVSSGISTMGGDASTVNSTYAERELLRRLKSGWTSTGEECECGMPIISKAKSDVLECVICGVIDVVEQDEEVEVVEEIHVENSPGVLTVGTNMSTITPSLEESGQIDTVEEEEHGSYEKHTDRCHKCQTRLVEDAVMMDDEQLYCEECAEKMYDQVGDEKSESDAAATETETKGVDDSYNEELGLKLFDGWVLTKLNCPGCNLPLISEYEGAPSVCLRCE